MLKSKYPSWTAGNALSTGDAVTIDDRFALPGEAAHVDPDRAVVGTNAALHAAKCIRDHLAGSQDFITRCLFEPG